MYNLINLAITAAHFTYEAYLHALASNQSLPDYISVDNRVQFGNLTTEQPKSRPALPPSFPTLPEHFAFSSRVKAGQIAFIPQGKHTRHAHQTMKFGKYLKKYFKELSDDDIRILSNEAQSLQEHSSTFELLTESIDCLNAYRLCDEYSNLSSCMTHSYSRYSSAEHPMSTLFNHPDIGVFMVYKNNNPVARALVDHRRKIFPMVYGRWELIESILRQQGYRHRSLSGLTLDVEWHDEYESIMLPYIDGYRTLDRSHHNAQCFDFNSDNMTITLTDDGEYSADDTDGVKSIDDSNRFYCECCESYQRIEDSHSTVHGESVCDSCAHHHYTSAIDVYGDTVLVPDHDCDLISAVDGTVFADDEAAYANDYRDDKHDDWYHIDDLVRCDLQDCYVHIDDLDDYHQVANDCGDTILIHRSRHLRDLTCDLKRIAFSSTDITDDIEWSESCSYDHSSSIAGLMRDCPRNSVIALLLLVGDDLARDIIDNYSKLLEVIDPERLQLEQQQQALAI